MLWTVIVIISSKITIFNCQEETNTNKDVAGQKIYMPCNMQLLNSYCEGQFKNIFVIIEDPSYYLQFILLDSESKVCSEAENCDTNSKTGEEESCGCKTNRNKDDQQTVDVKVNYKNLSIGFKLITLGDLSRPIIIISLKTYLRCIERMEMQMIW